MNAIQFKEGLKVSKFRRSLDVYEYYDYAFDINENTYYIYKHKNNTWSAYDLGDNEFYAISNTRKEVVTTIISGLYYQYKHNVHTTNWHH